MFQEFCVLNLLASGHELRKSFLSHFLEDYLPIVGRDCQSSPPYLYEFPTSLIFGTKMKRASFIKAGLHQALSHICWGRWGEGCEGFLGEERKWCCFHSSKAGNEAGRCQTTVPIDPPIAPNALDWTLRRMVTSRSLTLGSLLICVHIHT